MDIQIYTQKMMAQIRKHPQGAVSEFESEISRADFIKIAASILKNYGGTASHKFLLKYNQSFLSLDINELQECVALIKDDVYGLDALVAFYFFFTNIRLYLEKFCIQLNCLFPILFPYFSPRTVGYAAQNEARLSKKYKSSMHTKYS